MEFIAASDISLFRDVALLEKYNKHSLWGQRKLFKGMHLRLPAPPCYPDHTNPAAPILCHTVSEGETLDSVAEIYESNATALYMHNSQRLGSSQELAVGMSIRVPHPHPFRPLQPGEECVPDKFDLWTSFARILVLKIPAPGSGQQTLSSKGS